MTLIFPARIYVGIWAAANNNLLNVEIWLCWPIEVDSKSIRLENWFSWWSFEFLLHFNCLSLPSTVGILKIMLKVHRPFSLSKEWKFETSKGLRRFLISSWSSWRIPWTVKDFDSVDEVVEGLAGNSFLLNSPIFPFSFHFHSVELAAASSALCGFPLFFASFSPGFFPRLFRCSNNIVVVIHGANNDEWMRAENQHGKTEERNVEMEKHKIMEKRKAEEIFHRM